MFLERVERNQVRRCGVGMNWSMPPDDSSAASCPWLSPRLMARIFSGPGAKTTSRAGSKSAKRISIGGMVTLDW